MSVLRPSRALAWLPLWAVAVLAAASFHMLEHVLQTYQAYVLRSEHAHGLLGRWVDTEWIHLAYNLGFLLAILPVAAQGGDSRSLRFQLFLGGVAAAGYHVVEHSVKTWQFVVLGHDPALGIAGHYGPLIPIHLWLNLVVYLLTLPHLLSWARQAFRPHARRAARSPAAATRAP
jgi:hypothetical protein